MAIKSPSKMNWCLRFGYNNINCPVVLNANQILFNLRSVEALRVDIIRRGLMNSVEYCSSIDKEYDYLNNEFNYKLTLFETESKYQRTKVPRAPFSSVWPESSND